MAKTMKIKNNKNEIVMRAARRSVVPLLSSMAAPAAMHLGREIVPYVAKNVGAWIDRAWANRMNGLVLKPGNSSVAGVANTVSLQSIRPSFFSAGGEITVIHRELTTSVTNSSDFVVNNGNPFTGQFRVSAPGGFAPWLVNIATCFDEFRVNKLRWEYIPSCATTETGRLGLFWDKDSQDILPSDRTEVSSFSHTAESAPWCAASLNVNGDNKYRFTNDTAVTDTKLTDFGRLGFYTYGGGASTNTIGDVYCTYSVTFREAQPGTTVVSGLHGNGLSISGPSFGPAFGSVGFTATSVTYTATIPGTYMILFGGAAGTGVATTTGGNYAVSGAFHTVITGGNFAVFGNFRTTGPYSSTPTFTFTPATTLGVWDLRIVRVNSTYNFQ